MQCVLSDGSEVFARHIPAGNQLWLFRQYPTETKNTTLSSWCQLLRPTDSGADFDKIKAFAAYILEGAR